MNSDVTVHRVWGIDRRHVLTTHRSAFVRGAERIMVLNTVDHWEKTRNRRQFKPRDLYQIAEIAQHDKSPAGAIKQAAVEQQRSYNAIKTKVMRMRKDESWKKWIQPSQEVEFARFRE